MEDKIIVFVVFGNIANRQARATKHIGGASLPCRLKYGEKKQSKIHFFCSNVQIIYGTSQFAPIFGRKSRFVFLPPHRWPDFLDFALADCDARAVQVVGAEGGVNAAISICQTH